MEASPTNGLSPKVSNTLAARLRDRQSKSPLTQTPTSNDLMLYPPSQTIGESLSSLASSTASKLETIWNEVGYTPEERAGQIAELLSEMKRLCDEKITEEQGVAEQFRSAIADAKEERMMTCAALNVDLEPTSLQSQGEQSLTDELATLELSLENLRAAANAAKEDLVESQTKLIKIHNILGSQMPKEWEDMTSDLTDSRRQAFHEQLQKMEEIKNTRMKAVIQLLLDCQHLFTELKLDCRITSDETYLSNMKPDFDVQIMGSLAHHDNKTHTLKSLETSSTTTGISASVLDRLTKRLAELSQEKRRRKKYLGELGQAIASLWEKLRIPEEIQLSFTSSVKGLGMDTIEKGEMELQRLTSLKAEMIGNLIVEAREKIQSLCKETHTNTEKFNATFEAGKVADESLFTDDLLAEHERHIHILQVKADQMRPIFKFIDKREDIIRERMEYEELQKDPERLQQRGAALTKQLMKEEKMSKRIKKDLPKYTEVITKRLKEWEKEQGESFLYNGESYLELMKKQEDEWQSYRNHEIQMKLKKKQMGMVIDKNALNVPSFKPLPGKKKPIAARSSSRASSRAGSRTRPLSDSTCKQNQNRNTSHARVEKIGRKGTSVSSRMTQHSC